MKQTAYLSDEKRQVLPLIQNSFFKHSSANNRLIVTNNIHAFFKFESGLSNQSNVEVLVIAILDLRALKRMRFFLGHPVYIYIYIYIYIIYRLIGGPC